MDGENSGWYTVGVNCSVSEEKWYEWQTGEEAISGVAVLKIRFTTKSQATLRDYSICPLMTTGYPERGLVHFGVVRVFLGRFLPVV